MIQKIWIDFFIIRFSIQTLFYRISNQSSKSVVQAKRSCPPSTIRYNILIRSQLCIPRPVLLSNKQEIETRSIETNRTNNKKNEPFQQRTNSPEQQQKDGSNLDKSRLQ
jgi:hypothetical protein